MNAKSLFTYLILPVCLLAASNVPVSAQHSLYRDVKAQQVGDIITVVLMENISGSTTTDSRRTSRTSGDVSGSTSSNFLPFEPYFGANTSVNYNADERNLANQRQLLSGYLSVQIQEVTDRGDLVVSGIRITEINGELHELSLDGIIRSNDVDSRNRVPSYRVANAQINYQKMGGVKTSSRRPGFSRRLIFYGVGVAMGTAILVRELQ
jgi:flagellar L-ring protein FlgH